MCSTIYDSDIYSFYTTFGQELGKWSYQLGARLESIMWKRFTKERKFMKMTISRFILQHFVTYKITEMKNSLQA